MEKQHNSCPMCRGLIFDQVDESLCKELHGFV